ncbi:MAG: hypothetical protein AMXMBFR61_27850 [Fimbriimonadales bacterium]
MVRAVWMVAALVAASPAVSQRWWVHEKLLEKTGWPLEHGWPHAYSHVNRMGTAAFTVQQPQGMFEVFRNNHSISQEAGGVSGLVGGLNELGQVAWRGGGQVWVDTARVSEGLIHTPFGYSLSVHGPTSDGRAFWAVWYGTPVQGYDDEAYLGRESLEVASLLGANREVSLRDVNSFGDALWHGKGDTVGSFKVFRNRENLTAKVFTDRGAWGEAVNVNERGQALWNGAAGPRSLVRVYVDDTPLPNQDQLLGGGGTASGRALNDRGDVLWDGAGQATNNLTDVFLNGTNLSRPFYGSRWHQTLGYYLSENGHAVWQGSGDLGDGRNNWDVFVNSTCLSAAVLGANRQEVEPSGVDDLGNVLWHGYGQNTNGIKQVFVNQFNLSADVRGGISRYSIALAMGRNGHVLWADQDENYQWDIWLSTPVPEPGGALALPFALGLLALGRRRRRR